MSPLEGEEEKGPGVIVDLVDESPGMTGNSSTPIELKMPNLTFSP
jgi:hypothetical protein